MGVIKNTKMDFNFDAKRHPILLKWMTLNVRFVIWCLRNDPDSVMSIVKENND